MSDSLFSPDSLRFDDRQFLGASVVGWFRRRWICRDEYESMKTSLETRITLLEAALARYEGQDYAEQTGDNLSFALLDRLKAKARHLQ